MRSNRLFMGLVFSVVILALTTAMAAQTFGARQVKFDNPVRVQGQLLPAGEYKIEHVMEGQKHIMVFKQVSGDKQEFRLNCNIVQLPSKAKQSTSVYDTSSGTRVLKAMTFAGDNYEHVFGE